ncbi:MAG: DUF1697 domain-containing protein [Solirubrobacterales bacterium]|nr:DUF1697 domain-containing protein [Solirubrobacterales bacterium]
MRTPAAPRVVILLRGINVGRSRRVAMPELRSLLERAGYEGVRTHLNSGNVVLRAARSPAEVGRAVEALIADHLGLEVAVVTRTGPELDAVVAVNPLTDVAHDGAKHLVAFLAQEPDPAALDALALEDLGPERFAVSGREIHLWCPDGVQDSRLAKAMTPRRLGTTPTLRNWNTVTRLRDLAAGA